MFGSIKEIDATELLKWLENRSENLRILDVREIAEMTQGMVPGAEPVPLATVPLRLNEFSPKDTLVMVCRSGARSAQACMYLQQQGFEQVYNLQRGMLGWMGLGLPMTNYVARRSN